jgi:hypothetical protein
MSNTNDSNNKRHVSSKTTEWLKDEGYTFVPYEDPSTDFCLHIKELDNPPIFVGMEKDSKDSVMVYTRIDLSELDKKAYSTLHTNVKKEFPFALASSLSNLVLPYQIHPNTEQTEYLEMKKNIFFDGLTKDRFFDTMDRVLAGIYLARMAYDKYLYKGNDSNY